MKRSSILFALFTLAASVIALTSQSASASQNNNKHNNKHQNQCHNGGHNKVHLHVYQHKYSHVYRNYRYVPRVVVQTPVAPKVVFFGPGHRKYNKRFHTLVVKNKLPLPVQWNVDHYVIQYKGHWVKYDKFVNNHCYGNWDWYHSKYRAKYGFK